MPEFVEQRLSMVRDAYAVFQPGRAVEVDAQPFAHGVNSPEIRVRPLVVFTHQRHIPITSLRHFLQALFEREIGKNSPQHDRQLERHSGLVALVCRQYWVFTGQVGNVTHPISPHYRPSNSLNKCSSIHHSPSPETP
jgi:hypothetical protein